MKDIIIIGQGPAGLSAALYGCRAKRSVLVIGKGGGALEKADKIENYFGLAEPLSGKQLLEIGKAQASALGAELVEDEVVGISLQKGGFSVDTIQGRFQGRTVILATGAPRKVPSIQGIADFEGRGVSYCAVCDAFFFRGKDVAVLGSGPYALHELEFLLPMVNSAVLLTNGAPLETASFPEEDESHSHKIFHPASGETGASSVKDDIETNQPLAGVNEETNSVLTDSDSGPGSAGTESTARGSETAPPYRMITEKISGLSGKDLLEEIIFENGEILKTDGLFIALGTAGALDLARKLGVAVQINAVAADENMATNIPGFFAAGDCTGGLLQVSSAVAEGAKAALSAVSYLRTLKD